MLRFDSFLSKEPGVGPGPDPLPELPAAANLRYWFAADYDAYSDDVAATACTPGDGVYNWLNQGAASDWAVQASEAARPIFRTGGHNGMPYLECDQSVGQYFADLAEGSQPDGITNFNRFTAFAVVSLPDPANFGGTIIGTTNTGDGDGREKNLFELTTDSGGSVVWVKSNNIVALPDQSDGGLNVIGVQWYKITTFAYGLNGTNRTAVIQSTNADSSAIAGMAFLRRRSNGENSLNADLYEFLYYDIALDSADFNTVMNYLRAKYGLATVS